MLYSCIHMATVGVKWVSQFVCIRFLNKSYGESSQCSQIARSGCAVTTKLPKKQYEASSKMNLSKGSCWQPAWRAHVFAVLLRPAP